MKHRGRNIDVRTTGSGAGGQTSLQIFTVWLTGSKDGYSLNSVIITKPHRQIYISITDEINQKLQPFTALCVRKKGRGIFNVSNN